MSPETSLPTSTASRCRDETGGVGNFWYSFDYGLAHFVSIDGETDYDSPEYPFLRDLSGDDDDGGHRHLPHRQWTIR